MVKHMLIQNKWAHHKIYLVNLSAVRATDRPSSSSVMSFEEEIDYLDVTFGSEYLYSGNVRVFVHRQNTTPLVTLVTPKGIGYTMVKITKEPSGG